MDLAYPRHLPVRHRWTFPLPRTHAGVPLANGRFGVLAWGGGRELRLTLGLGDLWDHRGGHPWTEAMSFSRLRSLLEAKDEAGLRAVFELHEVPPGKPRRPSILPVGRVDVVLPEGWELAEAVLDFPTGTLDVVAADPSGARRRLRCGLAAGESLLWIAPAPGEAGLPPLGLVARPAWEWVGGHLAEVGFSPPAALGAGRTGWVQPLPADPAVAVAAAVHGGAAWVAVARAAEPAEAARAAASRVDAHGAADVPRLAAGEAATWAAFWASVPDVELPEPAAAFRYAYGMYKFGAATRADGPAVTLQGPWIEEHQLPPWQSDYHFNINVQMCAWPAFGGNRLADLVPLFEMVDAWRPQLRENARLFAGVDDGLLLPHAVDDRATCMGGFWTGTVDQACTAWMALTMMDAWRHGHGDAAFLRDRVKPWLRGALRVFEAMTDRLPDGRRVLPVSVSPEYRGNAFDAWGANASFQVGCIHAVVEALEELCAALGEAPEPWWRELADALPKACVGDPGGGGKPRILLWEGTDLEESHRHHSHWGPLYPWDVVDVDDPAWADVLEATWRRWWEQGMGKWSGWCIAWAAMLHARMGRPMMATALPDLWERLYVNEGHGTLHDPRLQPDGGSVREPEARPPAVPFDGKARGELMQLDAGFAITAATLDLLVHVRRGVHHLFTGVPPEWRTVGFDRVLTRGAFLVSARRVDGRVVSVAVEARRGGTFRLRSPWGGSPVRAEGVAETRLLPDARGVVTLVLPAAGRAVLRGDA